MIRNAKILTFVMLLNLSRGSGVEVCAKAVSLLAFLSEAVEEVWSLLAGDYGVLPIRAKLPPTLPKEQFSG